MMAVLNYYWLPPAATHLVAHNREFEVRAHFKVFDSLWVEDSVRTLKVNNGLLLVSDGCPSQPVS